MRKTFLNTHFFILSSLFILLIISCSDYTTPNNKPETPTEETKPDPEPEIDPYMLRFGPIGMSHENITATTVSFAGSLDIDMLEGYDMNGGGVGFIFCPSDEELNIEQSTVIQISEVDAEGKFTKQFTNLRYNTEYKYAIFVFKNSICQYSDSRTFSTKNVSISLSTNNYSSTSVDINARISGLVNEDDCKDIEIGICYSTNAELLTSNRTATIRATLANSTTEVKFSLKDLYFTTTYYYCYYIKQHGETTYGTANKFTTSDPYVTEAKNLDIDAAINLSSNGTSNCYIISEPGLYKFKTVKGNSNTSVGEVVSCALVWESYGTSASIRKCDLIDGIFYRGGYIAFQTPTQFKEGNAVIAAKNSKGEILWSWHIWLTDTPAEQIYYNNAGTMMDRNLGATSTTPGDVAALGLLYQWGRKDPFLGSSTLNSENPTKKASSTIEWPFRTESTYYKGTIEYSILHPTQFIYRNKNNYDWDYDGYSNVDHTKWQISKTIYDPCPVGWRVPTGGDYGVWTKANEDLYSMAFDEKNRGINFSKKLGSDTNIWYPMAGYKHEETESLTEIGYSGYYWSVTKDLSITTSVFHFYDYRYDSRGAQIALWEHKTHAYGYSVRCQKE